MATPLISIIHPTRRPDQAHFTIQNWHEKMSLNYEVEYILSVDTADPRLSEYMDFNVDMIVVSNNENLVQAANSGAREARGHILVLVSDDFDCFFSWDIAIVQALEGKSGVLKTYDGTQKWIVTLMIITKDYYEEQGHIYDPRFQHLFVDTFHTHKAELEGKLIIRNDIEFRHRHYSTGGVKDAISTKADSTWAQGEKLYLDWCREMSKKVDIFSLSKEAKQAGHVNWLKKKLNVK